MSRDDWEGLEEVARKAQGLPFPDNFFRAEHNRGVDNDAKFIHEQLSQLTLMQRERAAKAYSDAYQGVDSRKDCNTRLRAFVERCKAANSGKTKSPRRVKQ